MAIYYVDLVSGNDANGGTDPLLPKLTVASAVTAASANDEIRIAKTASPTVISGCTFGFTLGSPTITTSADMRGSLAVNDIFGKTTAQGNGYQTETYYRVHVITASAITLQYKYGGTTENVTSINKIVGVVGVYSISSKAVACSGGWTLSTLVRDGETWIDIGGGASFSNATFGTSYMNFVLRGGSEKAGIYSYCTSVGGSTSSYPFYEAITTVTSCVSSSSNTGGASGTLVSCLFVNCDYGGQASTCINCISKGCSVGVVNCLLVTGSSVYYCTNGFSGVTRAQSCSATSCANGFGGTTFISCTATSCTNYGFNRCQNLISCNAIDCSTGFYNPYYMIDCSTLRSTLYGISAQTSDPSAGACIRNYLSTSDAIGVYVNVNTVNCYNCSFITPGTWGISRVLTAGAAITCVGCTIDTPSLSKAYNRVAGASYAMPQYYLQNSFNNLTGTIYANTTVLEDTTTTPHSLQIIFYGTSGLQFAPIRVAFLWSKQSIPLTITLQVWAPSGTFTGTAVPFLTLNGATLITLPTITTITSSVQTLTFNVSQAMMTADGMLEVLVVPNGNNTPINFGNLTVVKA